MPRSGTGQRRRSFGQRAVTQGAPARGVRDAVVGGPNLGCRYAPLRSRGLFQHRPRRRSCPAHRHEPVTQAARTIRILVAEALLVAPSLGDANPRPIGLEFVGHHHGDGGAHALAHFGAVADHGNGAVLGQRDVDGGIVAPTIRHSVRAELLLLRGDFGRQARGENEHAGTDAGEQAAAADIDEAAREVVNVLGHSRTPLAACLMAARMRG